MQLMHECQDSRDDHYAARRRKRTSAYEDKESTSATFDDFGGEHENISKTTKNTVTAVELLTVLQYLAVAKAHSIFGL